MSNDVLKEMLAEEDAKFQEAAQLPTRKHVLEWHQIIRALADDELHAYFPFFLPLQKQVTMFIEQFSTDGDITKSKPGCGSCDNKTNALPFTFMFARQVDELLRLVRANDPLKPATKIARDGIAALRAYFESRAADDPQPYRPTPIVLMYQDEHGKVHRLSF